MNITVRIMVSTMRKAALSAQTLSSSREARLDFTISPKITQKLRLQRATIGVYGRDLFIWSPWPMFDPEFGTLSGTDIVRGFETAQFPSTRTLGVNLVIGL